MKRIILWLLLTIVLTTSCKAKSSNSNNDDNTLAELTVQLNSLNLEDGQKLYLMEYDGIVSFIDYMEHTGDVDTKIYTEEEEIEMKTDLLPTSVSTAILTKENLQKNITVNHRFADPIEDVYYHYKPNLDSTNLLTSFLVIKNKLEDFNRYSKYNYTLDSIYYKDGSSKKVELEFEKFLPLDNLKLIDKLSLTVDYPKDLAMRTISNKQKTAKFGDATITLESIDKNIARYRIEGEECELYVTSQAKTKSGYYLNYVKKDLSIISRDEISQLKPTIEKYLGKVAEKARAGEYKNKEDFIADVKENASHVHIPSQTNHRSIIDLFAGNIDELYLYFTEKKDKGKIRITVPVKEELSKYNLRMNDLNKGTNVIIDENNRIVARISENDRASQLNNYYYSIGSDKDEEWALYRLDPEKGLTKVDANYSLKYTVDEKLSDDLLKIKSPKDNYKNGALDRYGKVVIPIEYFDLKKSETEDLIIASNGNPISDDSNYTLYDLSGNKIASGDGYISISGFNDGVASVKKYDKIGYIDTKGKLIIPFVYDTFSSDFENGVAMVKNSNGDIGLINKKNEIVVPFAHYSYMKIDTNEQGRVYVLDNEEYDSSGKRIK